MTAAVAVISDGAAFAFALGAFVAGLGAGVCLRARHTTRELVAGTVAHEWGGKYDVEGGTRPLPQEIHEMNAAATRAYRGAHASAYPPGIEVTWDWLPGSGQITPEELLPLLVVPPGELLRKLRA